MLEQDVVIIGAGAAGLMCALSAGQRQRRVTVLEHGKRPGRKILISGGGRCNFTNDSIEPEKYLSQNPHFCKSALAQYSQWDFIALVEKHGITYHEKEQGQLFCDNSARDIVNMLVKECQVAQVHLHYRCDVQKIQRDEHGYFITTTQHQTYRSQSLVIATGGLSMPRLGATPFALQIAKQFDLAIIAPRAGLVPLTLNPRDKEAFAHLTGVSLKVRTNCNRGQFLDDMLFTHRGLSGPSILQISSYWQPKQAICVDLAPTHHISNHLQKAVQQMPKKHLKASLLPLLPNRLIDTLITQKILPDTTLKALSCKDIDTIHKALHLFMLYPDVTEGYRTAEVTLGGVATDGLSSKTMMVKRISGLYFVGEAVDVTGWLGGYNFQWAWSSGWVAGQNA